MNYSSVAAAKATGATLRQLQFWDENKVVVAYRESSKQRRRLYSEEQIKEIRRLMAVRSRYAFKFAHKPLLLRSLLAFRGKIKVITKPEIIGGIFVIPSPPWVRK